MSHVVIFCALLVLTIGAPYPPKRLAGPVEEFSFHRIVDPSTVITSERSASQYIWFDTTTPGTVYSTTIPVDGPNEFVFTFASPQESKLALKLVDPTGKEVDLTAIKKDGTFPIGDSTTIPVSTYIVTNSIQGFYKLSILLNGLSVEEATVLAANPYPNAILTVINNDELEIQSHLSSYLIDVGDTIGIVSTLVNLQAGASPATIHVTHAEMDVITPDGQDIEVQMHNDEALVGNVPNTFGAIISANVPGSYLVQARLEGWVDGGAATVAVPFTRTTEHVIGVSAAAVGITGSAQLRSDDQTHAWIDVNVKQLSATTGKSLDELNFRAYAEVWGTEAFTGKSKAACWIGGVSAISTQPSGTVLSLQLDTAWLQRAGVQVPLTLKNVYVTDMATSFPVAKFDGEIPVQHPAEFHVTLKPELLNMEITQEMRVGISPLPAKSNQTRGPTAAPTLFLLPGYCASVNPWGKQFSSAEYFVEKGNFGNDEYAQKAMNYINSHNPDSFSLIGHSQGGFVSLHINNFYFTPLEGATGGRLIQTVGTPWQGCSGAGSAAGLGKVFGIGCGSNSDLTRDGAANWLSGISVQSRAKVHSYTTTYKQGNFFGDYCSLPMNVILQWPNDGTTELKYGKLPGGQYEGNTEKQCHVSGMAYPSQTEDAVRNALMNKAAAR